MKWIFLFPLLIILVAGCISEKEPELVEISKERSQELAEAYVEEMEAYLTLNGRHLELVDTRIERCPYCWQFIYGFTADSETEADIIHRVSVTLLASQGEITLQDSSSRAIDTTIYCKDSYGNPAKTYTCKNNILKVLYMSAGTDHRFFYPDGSELVCPVVAPQFVTEDCKAAMQDDFCSAQDVCPVDPLSYCGSEYKNKTVCTAQHEPVCVKLRTKEKPYEIVWTTYPTACSACVAPGGSYKIIGYLIGTCDVARRQLPKAVEPKQHTVNKASEHCEGAGYTLEIRNDENGNEYGACIFNDTSECEEWAFYRGECDIGKYVTAPPPQ